MPALRYEYYECVSALLHAVDETETGMRRSLRSECRTEHRTDDGADHEVKTCVGEQQRRVRDRDQRANWGEANCYARASADERTDHSRMIDRGACTTISIERDKARKRVVGVYVCMYAMALRGCLCALRVRRADVQRVRANTQS
jgi:uncharacterized membrane protein